MSLPVLTTRGESRDPCNKHVFGGMSVLADGEGPFKKSPWCSTLKQHLNPKNFGSTLKPKSFLHEVHNYRTAI